GFIDTHPVDCIGNLALDHDVFLAAARAGASTIVFASSACVYPAAAHEQHPTLTEDLASFDEPGRAFPDGEYGWAKLMGERQLEAFVKEYGINATACRLFSAYGERENETHAVIAL